jgi:hypothetical protein
MSKKQSNNPRGRPKGALNKATKEIKELALPYAPDAVGILAGLMRSADSSSARVAAAKELLDRAYGKAPQALDGDGKGGPIKVEHVVRWLPPTDR